MKYDFKSARIRVLELKLIYYRLKRLQAFEPGAEDYLLMIIHQIEQEIEAEHAKMIALAGDHHVVKHENVLIPIIPAWIGLHKEEFVNA